MPFDIQLDMERDQAIRVSVRIPEKIVQAIDKLVDHGFYRDRADFVVTACRLLLEKHGLLGVGENEA